MRRRIMIGIFALLLLLSACAVENSPDAESGYISVYRLVKQGYRTSGSLIRAERLLCEDSQTETLVRGAAYALMSSPESEELSSAVPGGVRIEDAVLNGRTVSVLMNDAYLELSGMERTVIDSCVVLTMCSIPGVDYVSFRTANHTSSKPFSSEDILLKNTLTSENIIELRLYFPKAEEDVLAAEYRRIALDEDISPERRILDELIKGPDSSRLLPVLPEDTAVLSVYTQDGLCTVSFSEDFMSDRAYSPREISFAVYSIVDSLTCLSGVDRVQINVRNNAGQRLGDFDISQPFARRSSIIGSAIME